MLMASSVVAKLCAQYTQHFATTDHQTALMGKKSINLVVAEALSFYMGDRWNNTSLGKAAGIAANTVKNVLEPNARQTGKSGKEPSVKLTELALLAEALGLEVADLVTDCSNEERLQRLRRRAGEYFSEHGVLPPWAPIDPPQSERNVGLDRYGMRYFKPPALPADLGLPSEVPKQPGKGRVRT